MAGPDASKVYLGQWGLLIWSYVSGRNGFFLGEGWYIFYHNVTMASLNSGGDL